MLSFQWNLKIRFNMLLYTIQMRGFWSQCPCVCILKARSPMAKGLLKLRSGVTNWEFGKIWGENVVSFGRYSISRWFGPTEMTPESFLSEKHRNCYNTTDDFEFLFKVNETWWILHILWLSLGWKIHHRHCPAIYNKATILDYFQVRYFCSSTMDGRTYSLCRKW